LIEQVEKHPGGRPKLGFLETKLLSRSKVAKNAGLTDQQKKESKSLASETFDEDIALLQI
jgi:hypothetical protein